MFSSNHGTQFGDFYLRLKELESQKYNIDTNVLKVDIGIKSVNNGLIIYDQDGNEHIYSNQQSELYLGKLILNLITKKGETNE